MKPTHFAQRPLTPQPARQARCGHLKPSVHAGGIAYWGLALFAFGILAIACSNAGTVSPLAFFLGFGAVGVLVVGVTSFGCGDAATRVCLLMAVYCFNVAFATLLFFYYEHTYGSPYEYGGTDDRNFEEQAYAIVEMDWTNVDSMREVIMHAGTGNWHAAENYVFIVAAVHKTATVAGMRPHTLNPRLFNSLALSIISVLVYSLAKLLGESRNVATMAGYFCGLFPHMVFESAHIYRDTLFSLGVTTVVVCVVMLLRRAGGDKKGDSLGLLLALLVSAWLTSLLREQFVYVFVLLVIGVFVVAWRAPFGVKCLSCFGGTVALLLALTMLGHLDTLFEAIRTLRHATQDEHVVYAERGSMMNDGFGSKIFGLPFLISVPFRLAYASICPVPTFSGLISEKFHQLGTVVWFSCLPLLVRGCRRAFNVNAPDMRVTRRGVTASFVYFYCLVALMTLQSRQFTMYIPLASVLITSELARRDKAPWKAVALMCCVGAALAMIYAAVKGY